LHKINGPQQGFEVGTAIIDCFLFLWRMHTLFSV
jgi:hypothetical protein